MRPPGRRVANVEQEHAMEKAKGATGATTGHARHATPHTTTDIDDMLQDLIDEDQAILDMYDEPWDDTNTDPRADTGEIPTELRDANDATTAVTVTTGAAQVHESDSDSSNDNNDDQNDNRSIQVTYVVPGKRRWTTTLTRWNPHALRRMRQRLEDHEPDGEEERRERNGSSDSDSTTQAHGSTRDRENDVTRVGVT